jgi:hypothetical protein
LPYPAFAQVVPHAPGPGDLGLEVELGDHEGGRRAGSRTDVPTGVDHLGLAEEPGPVHHWTQQANPATAVPDDLTDLNVLLAACNRGTLHFGVRREPFDSAYVAGFLHRLADQVGHPLDVVVCRWPARHAAVVRSWLASPGASISIRFPG